MATMMTTATCADDDCDGDDDYRDCSRQRLHCLRPPPQGKQHDGDDHDYDDDDDDDKHGDGDGADDNDDDYDDEVGDDSQR